MQDPTRYAEKRGPQSGGPQQEVAGKTLEELGINVVIAVPMERNVRDIAFFPFLNIAQKGWPFLARPYGRVDTNRNEYGRMFLNNSKFTHIIMLDSDHQHPPDVVERLLRWVVLDPTKLVIAGLNFRRGPPYEPCAFMINAAGQWVSPVEWNAGIGPIDRVGHGAILIARKALEAMPGPWWKYEYPSWSLKDGSVFPSEDMYFSGLCREHGIDLWVDTTLTSPHIGDTLIDESVYRSYLEDHPELVRTVMMPPETDDPQPNQIGDLVLAE